LKNIHQNPSTINPFFFFSLRKQYQFVGMADLYFGKNRLNIRAEAGRLPIDYYGLGNFTNSENEVFSIKRIGLSVESMRHVTEHILVGGNVVFYHNKISEYKEDGQLIIDQPPGFNSGYLMGVGPSMGYDSRDNIIYPHNGTYIRTKYNFYIPGLNGDFHYSDFSFDVRKYFSTSNKKNTLAIQSNFAFQSNDNVPFYELNRVGGESRLRGVISQRYLDTKRGLAQIEYRRKLPFTLGFVLFGGAGKVFRDFENLNFDNLKYSYGFGFRWMIIPQELTNFRIDFGYGSNGEKGIYVGINEVF
jgi:outer membrane protein assembly factor BamA